MHKPFAVLILAIGSISPSFGAGLGVSIPLVGRAIGGGNTLFATAVDVTNNSGSATAVDFFFTGTNGRTGELISVIGTVSDVGLVSRSRGVLSGRTNVHIEDFIADLVTFGFLPREVQDDGITGSVLFVFQGLSRSGQGAVTARFYNALSGGTVGVAIKGHEITAAEPKKIVAAVRDTRGLPGTQIYPNLFINHTGLTPAGVATTEPVTVEISASANISGQPIGVPVTFQLRPGETRTIGQALQALQVPAGNTTILVTATVTAGNAAIAGVVSQVDAVTRDGSAFEMTRADF
jgi:hypothetical protein